MQKKLEVGLREVELPEESTAGEGAKNVAHLRQSEAIVDDERSVERAGVEAHANTGELALVILLRSYSERQVEGAVGRSDADTTFVKPALDHQIRQLPESLWNWILTAIKLTSARGIDVQFHYRVG